MREKFQILLIGDNEEDKKIYAEKFIRTIEWEDGWKVDWSTDESCICSMKYERSVGFSIINYPEDVMKTPEYRYIRPQYLSDEMRDSSAILFFLDAVKLIKRDWKDEMRFRRWMLFLQKYFTGAGRVTILLTNYEAASKIAGFDEIRKPLKPLLRLIENRDDAILEIQVLSYEENTNGGGHFTKPVLDMMLGKLEHLVKEQEKIYHKFLEEEEYYRRRSSLLDTVYKKYLCGGARTNAEYARDKREYAIDEAVKLKSKERAWQNLYWENKRLEGK